MLIFQLTYKAENATYATDNAAYSAQLKAMTPNRDIEFRAAPTTIEGAEEKLRIAEMGNASRMGAMDYASGITYKERGTKGWDEEKCAELLADMGYSDKDIEYESKTRTTINKVKNFIDPKARAEFREMQLSTRFGNTLRDARQVVYKLRQEIDKLRELQGKSADPSMRKGLQRMIDQRALIANVAASAAVKEEERYIIWAAKDAAQKGRFDKNIKGTNISFKDMFYQLVDANAYLAYESMKGLYELRRPVNGKLEYVLTKSTEKLDNLEKYYRFICASTSSMDRVGREGQLKMVENYDYNLNQFDTRYGKAVEIATSWFEQNKKVEEARTPLEKICAVSAPFVKATTPVVAALSFLSPYTALLGYAYFTTQSVVAFQAEEYLQSALMMAPVGGPIFKELSGSVIGFVSAVGRVGAATSRGGGYLLQLDIGLAEGKIVVDGMRYGLTFEQLTEACQYMGYGMMPVFARMRVGEFADVVPKKTRAEVGKEAGAREIAAEYRSKTAGYPDASGRIAEPEIALRENARVEMKKTAAKAEIERADAQIELKQTDAKTESKQANAQIEINETLEIVRKEMFKSPDAEVRGLAEKEGWPDTEGYLRPMKNVWDRRAVERYAEEIRKGATVDEVLSRCDALVEEFRTKPRPAQEAGAKISENAPVELSTERKLLFHDLKNSIDDPVNICENARRKLEENGFAKEAALVEMYEERLRLISRGDGSGGKYGGVKGATDYYKEMLANDASKEILQENSQKIIDLTYETERIFVDAYKGLKKINESGPARGVLKEILEDVEPGMSSGAGHSPSWFERMGKTRDEVQNSREMHIKTSDIGAIINRYSPDAGIKKSTYHAKIDPYYFEQALGNVVGNAKKYAASGSEVKIDVFEKEGIAHIQVTNQVERGGGLTQGQWQNALEGKKNDNATENSTQVGIPASNSKLSEFGGSIDLVDGGLVSGKTIIEITLPSEKVQVPKHVFIWDPIRQEIENYYEPKEEIVGKEQVKTQQATNMVERREVDEIPMQRTEEMTDRLYQAPEIGRTTGAGLGRADEGFSTSTWNGKPTIVDGEGRKYAMFWNRNRGTMYWVELGMNKGKEIPTRKLDEMESKPLFEAYEKQQAQAKTQQREIKKPEIDIGLLEKTPSLEDMRQREISIDTPQYEYFVKNGLNEYQVELLLRSGDAAKTFSQLGTMAPDAVTAYLKLLGRVDRIPFLESNRIERREKIEGLVVTQTKSKDGLVIGITNEVPFASAEGARQFDAAHSYLMAMKEFGNQMVANKKDPDAVNIAILPLRGGFLPYRVTQLYLDDIGRSSVVDGTVTISSPSRKLRKTKNELNYDINKIIDVVKNNRGKTVYLSFFDEIESGASIAKWYTISKRINIELKRQGIEDTPVKFSIFASVGMLQEYVVGDNPTLTILKMANEGSIRFMSEPLQKKVMELDMDNSVAVDKFVSENRWALGTAEIYCDFMDFSARLGPEYRYAVNDPLTTIRNEPTPPNISFSIQPMRNLFTMDWNAIQPSKYSRKAPAEGDAFTAQSTSQQKIKLQLGTYDIMQKILDAQTKP